jgi:hypothetical protein
VNCEVCGTELPHGAMFCGECGRAVGARSVARHPDSGMPVAQLGGSTRQQARDTVIIDPLDLESLKRMPAHVAPLRVEPSPEPAPEPPPEPELLPRLEPEPDAVTPAPIEQDLPEDLEAAEARAAAAQASATFPWGDHGTAIFSDSDELEQTLIVPRREQGERFVLQFSTGESVTVFGSGLLGRNPAPQPSEYFDQLVAISDPGKSVSKTHLEFGQDAGSFWVSDRFSGNGSVVREPEMPAHRLIAGKRYRIVRGTRVDIGEQFFVVS